MIDSAVKRSAGAQDDEALRAEKTVADAFSAIPHVISVAYVPREGIWLLFIVHDSDEPAHITEKLVDESVRVEDLPSVPILDVRVRHVSGAPHVPPEAKVLFSKR